MQLDGAKRPSCPLAQCELAGHRPRFLDTLFAGAFKTRKTERLGKALAGRVTAAG